MQISPYYLNLNSFVTLKDECKKQDYTRLNRLLNNFEHLKPLIKKDPHICYKLSNLAVKTQKDCPSLRDATFNMLNMLRDSNVFSHTFVNEKCTLKSSNQKTIPVNKTLLRFFCERFDQDIMLGTCTFDVPFSEQSIHLFKHILYKNEMPTELSLNDYIELYILFLWYKCDKLADDARFTKIIETKIIDLCKNEEGLEKALAIWEKILGRNETFEKIALEAFFTSSKIDYKISQDETYWCVNAAVILLGSDTLQKLIASHVNGLIITQRNFEDAALLAFNMTETQQLNQRLLRFDDLTPETVEAILSPYFRNKFQNLEVIWFNNEARRDHDGYVHIDSFVMGYSLLAKFINKLKHAEFTIELIGKQSTNYLRSNYFRGYRLDVKDLDQWNKIASCPWTFHFSLSIHLEPSINLWSSIKQRNISGNPILAGFSEVSYTGKNNGPVILNCK